VREHLQLVVVVEAALPAEHDREELALFDLELFDLEGGRHDGAHDGGSAGGSLVLVESGAGLLVEDLLDDLLDHGHASAAADDLDEVDVFGLEFGVGEERGHAFLDAGEERLGHLLEVVAVHAALDVDVVHEALDVEGDGRVVG